MLLQRIRRRVVRPRPWPCRLRSSFACDKIIRGAEVKSISEMQHILGIHRFRHCTNQRNMTGKTLYRSFPSHFGGTSGGQALIWNTPEATSSRMGNITTTEEVAEKFQDKDSDSVNGSHLPTGDLEFPPLPEQLGDKSLNIPGTIMNSSIEKVPDKGWKNVFIKGL